MMLSIIVSIFIAIAAAANNKVFLPEPTGEYFVGKTQHVFNHTTIDDPTASIGSNNTGKYIVLTILYPTGQAPTAETSLEYMDTELARLIEEGWEIPGSQLQNLWTHAQWKPPFLAGSVGTNEFPTLLLSPGAGQPCSTSTITASDLVSQGYTVLCIDHPGEIPYLKVPDGFEVGTDGQYGIPINDEWADETVLFKVNRNRKSDFDALLELFPPLVQSLQAPFNTSTYMHFGFSMGGSVGTHVVSQHDSIIAGLNGDGAFIDTLFGETVDVKKPFLIFRDGETRFDDTVYGQSFTSFMGNQTSWWAQLRVKGSRHLDFCDVGFWAELLDWNTTLVGTAEKFRMRDFQTSFTTAFFDMVLGKNGSSLLEEALPSIDWPEVTSINL
ncbi:hypothetical protein HYALB_00001781 [Hymenoscyphus albidus]|uniref:1-alkyl-2-acetylglycerophosphocholine esterase n=1 Tax=Hymenoscyphus albidus TaxID=595503 RepID=A0A9N9LP72_9HELO|nr:hypothetical protein HYALB_00001781 [Hymenoscyphus albidus]